MEWVSQHTSPVILDFSSSSFAIISSMCLLSFKAFIASSSVSSMYCNQHQEIDLSGKLKHKKEFTEKQDECFISYFKSKLRLYGQKKATNLKITLKRNRIRL